MNHHVDKQIRIYMNITKFVSLRLRHMSQLWSHVSNPKLTLLGARVWILSLKPSNLAASVFTLVCVVRWRCHVWDVMYPLFRLRCHVPVVQFGWDALRRQGCMHLTKQWNIFNLNYIFVFWTSPWVTYIISGSLRWETLPNVKREFTSYIMFLFLVKVSKANN